MCEITNAWAQTHNEQKEETQAISWQQSVNDQRETRSGDRCIKRVDERTHPRTSVRFSSEGFGLRCVPSMQLSRVRDQTVWIRPAVDEEEMRWGENVAALETLALPLRSAAAPVTSRAGPSPRDDSLMCVIDYIYLIGDPHSSFYRKL